MPDQVNVMLASTADKPFDDPNWIFELKWDGFRGLCYIRDGAAHLKTRNHIDLDARFPALPQIAGLVRGRNMILDGELVALDQNGVPRFQWLQPLDGHRRVSTDGITPHIVYYVFDIVYYEGMDLTGARLIDRKELLKTILTPHENVRYSDHIVGQGVALFEQARSRSLEGVMAKRSDSAYVGKRSSDWLKLKVVQQTDVVIGGYTEPRRSRSYLGSIVAGQYRDGELVFTGHVGVGTNSDTALRALHARLAPLASGTCPFATVPPTNEAVHWIRPELVAEIKYGDRTRDGILRHPILLGIREDKDPRECVFGQEMASQTVEGVTP